MSLCQVWQGLAPRLCTCPPSAAGREFGGPGIWLQPAPLALQLRAAWRQALQDVLLVGIVGIAPAGDFSRLRAQRHQPSCSSIRHTCAQATAAGELTAGADLDDKRFGPGARGRPAAPEYTCWGGLAAAQTRAKRNSPRSRVQAWFGQTSRRAQSAELETPPMESRAGLDEVGVGTRQRDPSLLEAGLVDAPVAGCDDEDGAVVSLGAKHHRLGDLPYLDP